MTLRSLSAAAVLAAAFAPVPAAALGSAAALGADANDGAVYIMTNDTGENSVVTYERGILGRLHPVDFEATGGSGSGGGLGNQGALTLSPNDRWLYAVNAGSDELSVLAVEEDGLALVQTLPSGGQRPISVTASQGLVYVLNAGGAVGDADGIAGFRQAADGTLSPIPGSMQALSDTSTGPAQIGFVPDAPVLVVTEKGTSRILTFVVDTDGVAGPAQVHDSAGATPFGFAFGLRNQLLVSEANMGAEGGSALSSYVVGADGSLELVSPSVATTETAACWTVVTHDGRFAFVTNTGSDSISAFRVGFDGTLRLRDRNGRTARTGAGPIDFALTRDQENVYALNSGDGTLDVFRLGHDGRLVRVQRVRGLPEGATGLSAR